MTKSIYITFRLKYLIANNLILIFSTLLFGILTVSQAQISSHYWSHQYGAKGLLLNGSIIGSVNDETAIFYNPAGMVIDSSVGISFSVLSPYFSILKTNNFLGQGSSSIDRGLGMAPGLVAAVIKPFCTDRISMGFTTFQRFQADINFRDRIVNTVMNNQELLYLGNIEFNRKINETWLGLGIGVRLYDKLKVGISQFFTFRSESMRLNFRKEILDKIYPTELVAGWRSDFGYAFSATGGMLTKFGLKWTPFNTKIGITYTTPSYLLLLKNANYSFDDQKVFPGGSSTVSSNDKDTRLNEYHTPSSLGFGIELPVKNSILSFSIEVFGKVNDYDLINDTSDPLEGKSPGSEPITVVVSQQSARVINFALGLERPINRKLTIYHGFRTDFNQNNLLNIGDGVTFLTDTPSIIHVSSGFTRQFNNKRLGVGLDYGFGFKRKGQQLTDLTNLNLQNIFQFSGQSTVSTYIHQFTLFITYDF